jgi:hypothetical protein
MSALVVLNVPQFPGANPFVPDDRFGGGNPLLRMWKYVKRQIVDDVPEAIAICQFDCPRAQCTQDAWHTCERRIRKSAGELIFASPLGKPVPDYHVFGA